MRIAILQSNADHATYKAVEIPAGQSEDMDADARRPWLWPHLEGGWHLMEFVTVIRQPDSTQFNTAGNRNPDDRYDGYKGRLIRKNPTADQEAAYAEGINARIKENGPIGAIVTQLTNTAHEHLQRTRADAVVIPMPGSANPPMFVAVGSARDIVQLVAPHLK